MTRVGEERKRLLPQAGPALGPRTHSSSTTSASSSGELKPGAQLLSIETLKDSEARWLMRGMKVATGTCICVVLIESVLRSTSQHLFILNRAYHIATLAVSVPLTIFLIAAATLWTYRVGSSARCNRVWSPRRSRACLHAGMCTASVLVALATHVAVHVMLLVRPEGFCDGGAVVVLSGARWFAWNNVLLGITIEGHGLMLLEGTGREDETVGDLPLWVHWPKFLLWAVIAGLLVGMTARAWVQRDGMVQRTPSGTCTWGDTLQCSLPMDVIAAAALVCVGFLVFAAMYAVCVLHTWRQLRTRLYQKFRMANILLNLQMRFNAAAFFTVILAILFIWLTNASPCMLYSSVWLGTLPILAIVTVLHIIQLRITLPQAPTTSGSDAQFEKLSMQQHFAWTDRLKHHKLAARRGVYERSGCREAFEGVPMFSFETAIKLFFWSALMYDYTEAEGHTFSLLPERIRVVLGEMENAMSLFSLRRRHMFYDRVLETKVVVAWNEDTILLCVRGTAEPANLIQDAKVVQSIHPPRRTVGGGVPRVHTGFLKTWHSNDVRERVMLHVSALLASAPDRASVRILATGHSLGGAVAALAILDIVRSFKVSPAQVQLYTFGCPRIGNAAFARDLEAGVPDSWFVINDQDVVPLGMKFWGFYKHSGNKVIMNAKGDLIVRPSLLEQSLLQSMMARSISDHLTDSYHQALYAVIAAQLSASKRHADGLEGLLRLLREVPVVHSVMEAHGLSAEGVLRDVVSHVRSSSRTLVQSASLKRMLRMGSKGTGQDAMEAAAVAAAAAVSDSGQAPTDALGPLHVDDSNDLNDNDLRDRTRLGTLPGYCTTGGSGDRSLERDTPSSSKRGRWKVLSALFQAKQQLRDAAQDDARRPSWPNNKRLMFDHSRPASQAGAADGAAHQPPGSSLPNIDEFTAVQSHSRDVSLATVHTRRSICYVIPEEDEDDDAGSSCSDGDRSEERHESNVAPGEASRPARTTARLCRSSSGTSSGYSLANWRCPLTASESDLPPNAALYGHLLEMGAAPDMQACRTASLPSGHQGSSTDANEGSPAQHSRHASTTGTERTLPPRHLATLRQTRPHSAGCAGELQRSHPDGNSGAPAVFAQLAIDQSSDGKVCGESFSQGRPRSPPEGSHPSSCSDCSSSGASRPQHSVVVDVTELAAEVQLLPSPSAAVSSDSHRLSGCGRSKTADAATTHSLPGSNPSSPTSPGTQPAVVEASARDALPTTPPVNCSADALQACALRCTPLSSPISMEDCGLLSGIDGDFGLGVTGELEADVTCDFCSVIDDLLESADMSDGALPLLDSSFATASSDIV